MSVDTRLYPYLDVPCIQVTIPLIVLMGILHTPCPPPRGVSIDVNVSFPFALPSAMFPALAL